MAHFTIENRHALQENTRKTLKEFFDTTYDSANPPIRFIGRIANREVDSDHFFESLQELVQNIEEFVTSCRPDTEIRFLAASRWPKRCSYFVLDVNNREYCYESAHVFMEEIPVYILQLSKRAKIYRYEKEDKTIVKRLRTMHNVHGQDPLPLFDDCTTSCTHSSARDWEVLLQNATPM
ncbi:hypothetical protein FE257_009154 [Aspergillus nanangensis]|uniref:Uncharacterized protein n=1 Tax=Aspergillus nanangensis TaxID=2582783 RepID=A0AAD4CKE4_ASPNN|nr:hypothetical protein FE257_009154 [Aspergillus nanangensis]